MVDQLALLGGEPIRTNPFSSRPYVDEREETAVIDTIRQGLFSRFVGSPLPGTRELLKKTSADIESIDGSHSFLGGANVRRFEAAWAAYHRVPFAVAVNSATSGITAALMAMNVGPGHEVITTPLSFTATATAIVTANAIPVFADIDPDTLCLDPAAVEKAITPQTRCIVPVHWCGNAGNLSEIMDLARKHKLLVLEDTAQAPGTIYNGQYLGTHGQAGVFSFSEPKNVMTGEGGMIVTADPIIAEKCRLIRNHGEVIPLEDDSDEYVVNVVGFNFRMVEATAAIGWVQTSKLLEVNEIRKRNYQYLLPRLLDVAGDYIRPQRLTHPESFYAYTAAFRWMKGTSGISRDAVAMALRAEGIPVATGVGRLLSDHPLFQRKLAFGYDGHPFHCTQYKGVVDYGPERLPCAHKVHDCQYLGFFLMGWPNTTEDMDDIVSAFRKIISHRDALSSYAKQKIREPLNFDRGRG
jgi:perosamine synthetase